MTVVYADELVTLHEADARDVVTPAMAESAACLIVDPPYDQPELLKWAAGLARPASTLVFTDPRHLGEVTDLFGAPAWVFTWDTGSTWNMGPALPVTRTKFCLWYGELDTYRRDATLWGDPPPAKAHPSTHTAPLEGRRLVDLWSQSLRWLHHPMATSGGSNGAERFHTRASPAAARHAKPYDWVRCLIGNTSPPGPVLDPFAGSGTVLVAARALGRPALGCEIVPEIAAHAADRLWSCPPERGHSPLPKESAKWQALVLELGLDGGAL